MGQSAWVAASFHNNIENSFFGCLKSEKNKQDGSFL